MAVVQLTSVKMKMLYVPSDSSNTVAITRPVVTASKAFASPSV